MKTETTSLSLTRKLLFMLPLMVLLISALANIVMAAHVSDIGSQIHDDETKTAQLLQHNDEMQQELAGKQSLAQLKVWADQQGFIPHGKIVAVAPTTPKLAQVTLP